MSVPTPRPAPVRAGAFTVFASVLFAGFAAGALWCVLALRLQRGEGLLIVPLALGAAAYFRWLGLRSLRAAIATDVALMLAFVYAQYLFAAVRVAQMLGFPLRSTLFRMDAALAWQAARANFGLVDAVALVVALVAGALLAAGWPGRARAAGAPPGR